MFRNIGKKEDYKESLFFDNIHYRMEWDKQTIMITDYEPEPIPLPEDYEPVPIGEHEDPVFCSWMQETFDEHPSNSQIENVIKEYYGEDSEEFKNFDFSKYFKKSV